MNKVKMTLKGERGGVEKRVNHNVVDCPEGWRSGKFLLKGSGACRARVRTPRHDTHEEGTRGKAILMGGKKARSSS